MDGFNSNNWLVITDLKTSKPLLIPFHEENSLSILALPPGNYKVEELINTPVGPLALASSKYDVKHIPFPEELKLLKTAFKVKANEAYYIGDYVATAETELEGGFLVIKAHHYYGLKSFEYKFIETTQELNHEYPEFIDVEKVSIYGE